MTSDTLTKGTECIKATEDMTVEKFECYNPFLCDGSCVSTNAKGGDMFSLHHGPAQPWSSSTNPFVDAKCQSYAYGGNTDNGVHDYPAHPLQIKRF